MERQEATTEQAAAKLLDLLVVGLQGRSVGMWEPQPSGREEVEPWEPVAPATALGVHP